jgi:Domain of unknown function (DUF4105)
LFTPGLKRLRLRVRGRKEVVLPLDQSSGDPERAQRGVAETIQNVRNFKYRSESSYAQRWETRTYNLDQVRSVDLFLSFWGPTQIAHTIASWGFDDGQYLAISIETRKKRGESYSALRGFFRQYELYYVVADERDLVGLRTTYRGEQVYLYSVRHSRLAGAGAAG